MKTPKYIAVIILALVISCSSQHDSKIFSYEEAYSCCKIVKTAKHVVTAAYRENINAINPKVVHAVQQKTPLVAQYFKRKGPFFPAKFF